MKSIVSITRIERTYRDAVQAVGLAEKEPRTAIFRNDRPPPVAAKS